MAHDRWGSIMLLISRKVLGLKIVHCPVDTSKIPPTTTSNLKVATWNTEISETAASCWTKFPLSMSGASHFWNKEIDKLRVRWPQFRCHCPSATFSYILHYWGLSGWQFQLSQRSRASWNAQLVVYQVTASFLLVHGILTLNFHFPHLLSSYPCLSCT